MNGFLKPFSFGSRMCSGIWPPSKRGRHLVAGLGALGTATGRLALGALTTTHAGLGGLGARGRAQVVQLERHVSRPPRPSPGDGPCGPCPRISGRSSLTTTSPIRLRPSERSVSRWFCLAADRRTSSAVTLSCAIRRTASASRDRRRLEQRRRGDVLDRQATASGHGLGLLQHPQRRDGRVHDVDLVGRAERLAQHVVDAGALEHGAHRATGDDAGTGSGRTQQDHAGRLLTLDGVRDGALDPRHLEEVPSWPPRHPWRSPRAPPWPCRSRRRPVPSPSPTTTRAVKLKRRPPFTTLATRLIATTRSM